ncbi:hypothetical protein Tco_0096651, partial [Tanacetum coccineum]
MPPLGHVQSFCKRCASGPKVEAKMCRSTSTRSMAIIGLIEESISVQSPNEGVFSSDISACVRRVCSGVLLSGWVHCLSSEGVFGAFIERIWLQKCITSDKIDACEEMTYYLLGLIREGKSKY